jgi:hypothetical protein
MTSNGKIKSGGVFFIIQGVDLVAAFLIIFRKEIADIIPFPKEIDDENPIFETSNQKHADHFPRGSNRGVLIAWDCDTTKAPDV